MPGSWGRCEGAARQCRAWSVRMAAVTAVLSLLSVVAQKIQISLSLPPSLSVSNTSLRKGKEQGAGSFGAPDTTVTAVSSAGRATSEA